ncbi:MAG: Peptide chain release factor 1-like, mitochondrial [Marteilia pararefringens]
MEITPGVGGLEASMFAFDLSKLYEQYFRYKNWPYLLIENQKIDDKATNLIRFKINEIQALSQLEFEVGTHRVQRVPSTDREKRIHTSTVSIFVSPHFESARINKHEIDKFYEREKSNIHLATFKATGAGGSKVNKTLSAVRLKYLPEGIWVECQEERDMILNKQNAISKLYKKLKEKEYMEHREYLTNLRQSKIGLKLRSEKIRTFNYPNHFVKDHRLVKELCDTLNLEEFFNSPKGLDSFISNIYESSQENWSEIGESMIKVDLGKEKKI